MIESNRRIASINRIDELNQRIAFQNDPKRPVDSLMGRQDRSKRPQEPPRAAQDPLKTAQNPPRPSKEGPRAPKSGPRPPQDDPKAPQDDPRPPPGALLTRSWSHLGTIKAQDRKQGRKLPIGVALLGRFWLPKRPPKRPQDDPKTSQKSRRKLHHFFIALGPVLDQS